MKHSILTSFFLLSLLFLPSSFSPFSTSFGSIHEIQKYSSFSGSDNSSSSLNLVFSTVLNNTSKDYYYYGGLGFEKFGTSIAVDSAGDMYILGTTGSSTFPTINAFQSEYSGGNGDVFVLKLSPTGEVLFSTYFGGSSTDQGFSIALDQSDNCYITGYTVSSDFPIKNAFQTSFGGGSTDAFIAKFNATGSLIFSTYLGGKSFDYGTSISVDSAGNSYVTGFTESTDFPTKNTFSSTLEGDFSNAFVAKFDPFGSLIYSTYFGGNASSGSGIAVDSSGNSYITGSAEPTNFPPKNAFQTTFEGDNSRNAFVAKFNATGGLVFNTYFGGNNSAGAFGIAIDSADNSFIIGTTFKSTFLDDNESFVAKFNSTGGLDFSTFLGSTYFASEFGIAVDSAGNSFIIGTTDSPNFPTKNAFQTTFSGGLDVFLVNLNATGGLVFSTFFGGSTLDYGTSLAVSQTGKIFITGLTFSYNFPHKGSFNELYSTTGTGIFIAEFYGFTSSSMPNSILNINNIILFFFSILAVAVLIFIIIEYRQYSRLKHSSATSQHSSYWIFLKTKLVTHFQHKVPPARVSDKIFELLDEIEQENTPEN